MLKLFLLLINLNDSQNLSRGIVGKVISIWNLERLFVCTLINRQGLEFPADSRY